MYANVLKFHIWIPHEKIGDPYFFYPNYLLFYSYFPFNKIRLKSRIFVPLLPSWQAVMESSSVGVRQLEAFSSSVLVFLRF